MGDQFEKFVKEHQDEFNTNKASEKLWKRIENDLEQPERRNWGSFWKIAAVLLLASTVYLSVDRLTQKSVELAPYQAEFFQAEAFYTSLIVEKRAEITLLVTEDLQYDFQNEIAELDLMYDDLRQTFDNTTSDQLLTDAMISNLQLRIQILNQQLKILKQLKRTSNENSTTFEI